MTPRAGTALLRKRGIAGGASCADAGLCVCGCRAPRIGYRSDIGHASGPTQGPTRRLPRLVGGAPSLLWAGAGHAVTIGSETNVGANRHHSPMSRRHQTPSRRRSGLMRVGPTPRSSWTQMCATRGDLP